MPAAVVSTRLPLATEPVKETKGTRGCATTRSIWDGVRWRTWERSEISFSSELRGLRGTHLADILGQARCEEVLRDALGGEGRLWGRLEEDGVASEEGWDEGVDLDQVCQVQRSAPPSDPAGVASALTRELRNQHNGSAL